MLNIQKYMFVLKLHCTLHSKCRKVLRAARRATWKTSYQLPKGHATPHAQYLAIPTDKMLCIDRQSWNIQLSQL